MICGYGVVLQKYTSIGRWGQLGWSETDTESNANFEILVNFDTMRLESDIQM